MRNLSSEEAKSGRILFPLGFCQDWLPKLAPEATVLYLALHALRRLGVYETDVKELTITSGLDEEEVLNGILDLIDAELITEKPAVEGKARMVCSLSDGYYV